MASSNDNNVQVSFVIKVDGKSIPVEIKVLSMRVEKNIHKNSVAQIVIIDGDASQQDFEISSSALFGSEKEITIEAGYNNQNQQIFSGTITTQSIRINQISGSTLEILCISELSKEAAVANQTSNTDSVLTITYGDNLIDFDGDLSLKSSEVAAEVSVQGTSLAEPGKILTLKGLGSRFSGNHSIAGVVHHFNEGNWLTEISIGLKNKVQDQNIIIEDQYSNSIVLSAEGITMKSLNAIKISGGMELKLNAAMIMIN